MTISFVVPLGLANERLDRVVALAAGITRSDAADHVDAGRVRVDGAPVTQRSRRLLRDALVEVEQIVRERPSIPPDARVEFAVVHADDQLVVVDKPAGLVVHPGAGSGATLVHGLLARYPEIASVGEATRPGIVHRLDKGTSGLLVVARTQVAYASLVDQIRRRQVDRRYLALVHGEVAAEAGVVDAPIGRHARDRTRMAVAVGGRESRTRYEVVQRWPSAGVTLLECGLETGRTHQVRVHFAAIGHPLVGDPRYGRGSGDLGLARPFLHACRLALAHPSDGAERAWGSPLPDDLAVVLADIAG